jgi:CheY-like chemotaxis protein
MKVQAKMGGRVKAPAETRPFNILVIEDNGSDVFLLERALNRQQLNFQLTHLRDGGEALAFVRQEGTYAKSPRPDLILVDLNLPKVDGEEIIRQIRGAKHLDGVPACVWTSSESVLDRASLSRLGASQFIFKPSGLEQFMLIGKTLKDLLSLGGRRAPTPAIS